MFWNITTTLSIFAITLTIPFQGVFGVGCGCDFGDTHDSTAKSVCASATATCGCSFCSPAHNQTENADASTGCCNSHRAVTKTTDCQCGISCGCSHNKPAQPQNNTITSSQRLLVDQTVESFDASACTVDTHTPLPAFGNSSVLATSAEDRCISLCRFLL